MPIHLNPFRLYKNVACLEHGLLVDILRNTEKFWDTYRLLLEINGKRQSDSEELNRVMKQMGLVPKENVRLSKKRLAKLLLAVLEDFDEGLKQINEMMRSLTTVIIDDETFFFSAVKELKDMYLFFGKALHIPDYMVQGVQRSFYTLLKNMARTQEHAWVVSKAHARGFVKLEELTIMTTRGERRRIRMQTVELDHIRNRIEPLRAYIERIVRSKTHNDIHEMHARISELLHMYNMEVTDLSHILHEGEVLLRRTKNLFKAIEREARPLAVKGLDRKICSYSERFHELLQKIEKQARRENIEVQQIVSRLPPPRKLAAKAA